MTEGQGASTVPVSAGGTGSAAMPVPEPDGALVAGDPGQGHGADHGGGGGGAHDGRVQAGGAQSASAQSASAQSASAQSASAQSASAQPGSGQPADSVTGGAHAAGSHAAGTRPDSDEPAGAHAGDAHPVGVHAAGARTTAPRRGVHAGPSADPAPARAAQPSTPRGSAPPERGPAGASEVGPGRPQAGRPGPARPGPGPARTSPAAGAARDDAATARSPGDGAPAGPESPDLGAPTEPYVKVDARRLEAALLSLRHPIVTVPLLLEAPGVAEARAERRKLLSQIDDYLLPRLRQSGAPILVALVGSTGAGKSTLMNSLVGRQVSQTGIRRPTTNSTVLACHPSDAHWFAENVFLPTLPRVRQQGLAMPGRDGLLVLAASEGMPKGVALLDTPDIDSVVKAHRDFAHQFLDASDLWLFMTSARRYADATVWELLQDARDRAAALAVVLSRVPPSAAPQLNAHFDAMLEANGLTGMRRFLIAETFVTDSMLPTEIARPVREWLEETASGDDRRVAVLTQTMSGMLDTFRTRIPALAAQAETQLPLRRELAQAVRSAYDAGLAEIDQAARDGSLMQGEVLARWQDFAGTGDLMRTLQVRRGRSAASKAKKKRLPARAGALRAALRTSLESLITATSAKAAEHAVSRLQEHPAGEALLSELAAAAEAGRSAASDYLAVALADLGLTDKASAREPAPPADAEALARPSHELPAQARQLVRGWQDRVLELVQAENVTKRSIARVVSFDHEPLALVLMISVLGTRTPARAGAGAAGPDAGAGSEDGVGAGPEQLLSSLFGSGQLRDLTNRARQDLHDRVAAVFDAELARFSQVIDAAGVPDDGAAQQLLAASQALEAAR
jgi:energy-coupling factor transporter ATP-binding protein EcfA2